MDINDRIDKEIEFLVENVNAPYEFRREVKSIINKEKLYRKFKVEKYNNLGIKQERIIVLTNKALYNIKEPFFIHKFSLKRRILYSNLKAISYSTKSNEIVIHGDKEEYDYHLITSNKKYMICYIALFYQKETSKSLKISAIPEESLKKYVTTKSDKKQDISNSKFDEKFLIDTDLFFYENLSHIQQKLVPSKIYDIIDKKVFAVHKLISKDYTIIERVCCICLKDKDKTLPKINEEEALNHQESKSKILIDNFINDVYTYVFDSLQDYTKPLKCTHFFHEECKNIFIKKYRKNNNFKCHLCEFHITLKNFYIFGPIKDTEFLKLVAKYSYIEDEDLVVNYFIGMELALKDKIVPMFYDQKTRNKLLKSLDLSFELKFSMGYKPVTFSIPLSKIDYYQNIVDGKIKKDHEENEKLRIRIQKEKEEEENKKKRRKYSSDSNSNSDSDDENKYQRNNYINKEKDDGNKVDYIKVCQKCKWICFLCRRNFSNENSKIVTQTRVRAHVKCINKEMCPLCRGKLGNRWTNYVCAKCRSKIDYFRCFNCNQFYK